jgi:hypothetical protein
MGREATCTVRFRPRRAKREERPVPVRGLKATPRIASGKALLETSELIFRGDGLRLKIPYAEMRAVAARAGDLEVRFPGGTALFALGAKEAATWADRIKNPPGRLDKLGVKPGMKVALVGEVDAALAAELRGRGAQVVEGRTPAGCDIIFHGVRAAADLDRLATLRQSLQPAGAIWVLRVKGPQATVTEVEVMAAGKAAGLVDTKVVSFDDRRTAERLVIPVSRR